MRLKIKLNKGKVIALRKKGKLIRYDENSKPFSVNATVGQDLVNRNCAILIKEDDSQQKSVESEEFSENLGSDEKAVATQKEDTDDV